MVAALALYRALLFIHELTHIHKTALPGFRLVWNLLVGIPMLTPSLMYENVHTLHHARTRYGTAEDPEYLPLALMKPWSLPLFILIALLAPVAFLVRFGILTPLGAVIPPLRTLVWERFSSLSINPDFRRRPPEGEFRRLVFWQEFGACVWALALMASVYFVGWRPLLIALSVVSVTAVLNQLRTLVAHLWENDGEPMTVTAQYLDTVNVPPPSPWAEFWAPVGLRYHALHHMLPSLPYHSLGEAHRRLHGRFGAALDLCRGELSRHVDAGGEDRPEHDDQALARGLFGLFDRGRHAPFGIGGDAGVAVLHVHFDATRVDRHAGRNRASLASLRSGALFSAGAVAAASAASAASASSIIASSLSEQAASAARAAAANEAMNAGFLMGSSSLWGWRLDVRG